MYNAKILLIEDDEISSELMKEFLTACGFEVEAVFNAVDGIDRLKYNNYDIMLLDINLPDFNGFEILKNVKNSIFKPVIVVSACSDTKSKVSAFKYGASDYMVKPIDFEELEARIWVQLGRYSEIKLEDEKSLFEIKEFNIFFNKRLLDLTTIEFDIFSILIKSKNRTISRERLLSSISTLSSPRSLDNHIKNIRKKIGDNGNKPVYIKTEYGIGYKLVF